MTIGEKISILRHDCGMSQDELAEVTTRPWRIRKAILDHAERARIISRAKKG